MRRHLLVTNDFPPKIGGIQSQLWELWRRLPPESFSVLTTPYKNDRSWDAEQQFEVIRARQWWMLPTGKLVRQINAIVHATGAEFVVLDPVVPLGLVGPKLDVPYMAIAHGAEYAIPARLWPTKPYVTRVTRRSAGMVASGAYVEDIVRQRLRKMQRRLSFHFRQVSTVNASIHWMTKNARGCASGWGSRQPPNSLSA